MEQYTVRGYPLRMRLHYRVLDGLATVARGTATTLRVSRKAVCFRVARPIPEGARMVLVIEWPALFGGIYPIELCVIGSLGGYREGEITVRIASWHFRVTPAQRNAPVDEVPVAGWERPCRDRATAVATALEFSSPAPGLAASAAPRDWRRGRRGRRP